ncbi:MAG TPA: citrate/2-methylcitrate synthase [Actinomycetota bacterium]|nr:citrate/2-methylcitrate synthase [Actinomycetota bacterium]
MTTEKGLEDVVAAQTAISDIDGTLGKLWYAGYSIEDLAERSTFEEVTFLLHHGRLPTGPELEDLTEQMVEFRETADFVTGLMPTLAEQTSPMSMLRTTVSAASAYDPDGWDQSPEANHRKAIRLTSVMPTLISSYDRHRRGLDVVPPNPKLPHAANFLYMLSGEEPDQQAARAFDVCFILYADHTMNASTFCARVVASTLADMHSAVVAAIAALKGPLHGGANEQAMRMLEEIGEVDRAEGFVRDLLARHQRVMGFGHRVYKTWDPRAIIMRELAREQGETAGDTRWFEISERIQKVIEEAKGLYPNVDLYAASLLHDLGLPTDLFTPMFAAARAVGWTAHIREQYADNRLIRPDSEYIGPRDQVWTPIEERTGSGEEAG